jgi:hypothetical protein
VVPPSLLLLPPQPVRIDAVNSKPRLPTDLGSKLYIFTLYGCPWVGTSIKTVYKVCDGEVNKTLKFYVENISLWKPGVLTPPKITKNQGPEIQEARQKPGFF